jgi:hypothetical protein
MSDQDTIQTPATDIQAPAADTTPPQLNITDLQNLCAIVDLAVRRGAFGASEASSVGAVFDRINTFLNSVAPQQPADDSTDTSAPTA